MFTHIMKVEHLNVMMISTSQFIETKINNSGVPQQKNINISIICCVLLRINQGFMGTSQSVHKSTYCLLKYALSLTCQTSLATISSARHHHFHSRTSLKSTGPSSNVKAPWVIKSDACAWWCGQVPFAVCPSCR